MSAANIARELGLKRKGHTWRGSCPIHGGSSFTIREKNGVPVFYCWSGCDRAAILAELQSRGLWPKADRTSAERREFAEQRRCDEADMREAGYFAMASASLAEQALYELSETDPQREIYTSMLRTMSTEAGILQEFRAWRERCPEFSAALVKAGQRHQERLLRLA